MKNLLLRYGVFAILVLMLVGILFILNRFDMRTKQAVNLVVGRGRAACTPPRPQPFVRSPAIRSASDRQRTATCPRWLSTPSVASRRPLCFMCIVPKGSPGLQSTLGGDTYATGYIFVGREKLRDKVLRRAGQ